MSNPFEDTDEAFVPMFLDTVEMSGTRKNGVTFRTSMKACVFPPERCEPFSDTQEDSKLMRVSAYVRKAGRGHDGWGMAFAPQTGDTLRLTDGTDWKLCLVREAQDWYEVEGRN